MNVKLWGTRGSIPTPGPETIIYGGETICVEVRADGNLIILDAGTGIRKLGLKLMAEEEIGKLEGHILLSHTHWDHIQGFPFFVPAFVKGNRFTIYGAEKATNSLEAILAGQMEHSYFPVNLDGMGAEMKFVELHEGQFHIGDTCLTTRVLNHPGGVFGYRIESGGKTFVYATDNEPYRELLTIGEIKLDSPPPQRGGPPLGKGKSEDVSIDEKLNNYVQDLDDRIVQLAAGADLLIHDAQFTKEEYKSKIGWGHSSVDDMMEIAIKAKAKKLVLFHHDPGHSDEIITSMEDHAKEIVRNRDGEDMSVSAARAGEEFTL